MRYKHNQNKKNNIWRVQNSAKQVPTMYIYTHIYYMCIYIYIYVYSTTIEIQFMSNAPWPSGIQNHQM